MNLNACTAGSGHTELRGIGTDSHSHSPVSPQLLHHVFYFLGTLRWIHLGITLSSKLCNVHFSKLFQSESPAMQARTKANCTKHGIDLKGKRSAVEAPAVSPGKANTAGLHQQPEGGASEPQKH